MFLETGLSDGMQIDSVLWIPKNYSELNWQQQPASRDFAKAIRNNKAQITESRWLGTSVPHRVICRNDHEIFIIPNRMHKNPRLCKKCIDYPWNEKWQPGNLAGLTQAKFEAAKEFAKLVTEKGGVINERNWLGTVNRHSVTCKNGHTVDIVPNSAKRTGSICRKCSGKDSEQAWIEFNENIRILGGTVDESKWLGCDTPHSITCSRGHHVKVRPSDIKQGKGYCRFCARRDSGQAWQEFNKNVKRNGGIVTESYWLGALIPHSIICKEGHEVKVRPANLVSGQGMCHLCRIIHDVFYIVKSDDTGIVKLGITSGDAQDRLKDHARDGYSTVLFLKSQLPMGVANDTEKIILEELEINGYLPVIRREYFGYDAEPLILYLVEKYLAAYSNP